MLFSSFLFPCLVVVRAPDIIGLKKSSGHLYCANCGKLAGKLIIQQGIKYAYLFNARITEFRNFRRASKYFFSLIELPRPPPIKRTLLVEERRFFPQIEEENSNSNEQDDSPEEEHTIELEIEAVQQELPQEDLNSISMPSRMKVFSSHERPAIATTRLQTHVDVQIPSTSALFPPRLVNPAQNSTIIISPNESASGIQPTPMIQNDHIDPWVSGVNDNYSLNTAHDLAYIDAATVPNPELTETDIDEILTVFNEEVPDLYQYI